MKISIQKQTNHFFAATAILVAITGLAFSSESAAQSVIRIESATYGGNVNLQVVGGNATLDIAHICDGRNWCDYRIEVARLGDPFPGTKKDFAVRFNCNGRDPRVARAEPEADNRVVRLSCE